MRNADNSALRHAWDRVDLGLDFLRVDVEAAGDDEILATADDVQIAARVELAEVAGDEEAIGTEFGRGFVRHVPVAGEHVRPFHLDHADFIGGQLGTGLGIGDANLNTGQGAAHGAGHARTVVRIGGDHTRLGHSVTFEDLVSGPFFPVAVGLCQ